jgi:hypothetical protein
MKPFFIFIIAFLWATSVYAQDLIVLRDGNIIEAKVTEITPTEIKYKRSNNLNGPTIVIDKADVLSIRYENRSVEIINPLPTARRQEQEPRQITPTTQGGQQSTQTGQQNSQTGQQGGQVYRPGSSGASNSSGQRRAPIKPQTALDPDDLTVAINANPAGLLLYGSSVCLELGKGKFNFELNLIIPAGLASGFTGGFGALTTFNRFWHKPNGGFYLGGGIGYIFQKNYYEYVFDGLINSSFMSGNLNSHLLTVGLNLGYKFVLESGLYFRTGACIGGGVDFGAMDVNSIISIIPFFNIPSVSVVRFYAKPDLTIGYCF